MDYFDFHYIYPPRPERKLKAESLSMYEKYGFMAQAKLNGSCAVLFLKGGLSSLWNRHGKELTRVEDLNFSSLSRGDGWTVLCGEYMNKSKSNALGIWNHKFVIWDIIVHNDKHLIGTTLLDRLALLNQLYGHEKYYIPTNDGVFYDRYLYQIDDNLFRARYFGDSFEALYDEITTIDMYEGLVLKNSTSTLSYGASEFNNSEWQFKVRKATKNYVF